MHSSLVKEANDLLAAHLPPHKVRQRPKEYPGIETKRSEEVEFEEQWIISQRSNKTPWSEKCLTLYYNLFLFLFPVFQIVMHLS